MAIQRQGDEMLLAAKECAARIGLTVRALRLYEQRGLIRPRRTAKGWRLYGAAEITRLHEVLALKRLGLSLSRITALLQGKAVDLAGTLAVQQAALSEQRLRLDVSLSLVKSAQAALAAGRTLLTEELIELAKEANMTVNDDVAWRRYEQARPRTAIPLDPALLNRYVGHYRHSSGSVLTITAQGGSLFFRGPGDSVAIEYFPETDRTFFRKAASAQISFTLGEADEFATEMVLHSNGHQWLAERIDAEQARKVEAELDDRIRAGTPHADSEAMLRRIIIEHQAGRPCVDRMAPEMAHAVYEQIDIASALLTNKGPLRDLKFKGISGTGVDVYDAEFAAGTLSYHIGWSRGGEIVALWMAPTLKGPAKSPDE